MVKFTIQPLLNVKLNCIKYICNVLQPPLSISRNFSSSPTDTLYLLNSNILSPFSPSPGNLYSLFHFPHLKRLLILGDTEQGNHNVCPFGLAYLALFKVHPCCVPCIRVSFFSRLSNIPVYVHTTFFSIYLEMGHSHCFYPSATVNSTAMNTDVYLFEPLLSILLGLYIEVGLVDHMVSLCSTFWAKLFCAAPFYIPPRIAQRF